MAIDHHTREGAVAETTARLARTAGILYLVIFVTAFFSEGAVRGAFIDFSDPAATAANLVDNAFLVRLSVVSDATAFIADAVVSVLLYLILAPTSKPLAMAAAALRLIAHPAIAVMNLVPYLGGLLVLDGTVDMAAFSPEQAQALSMSFLQLHHYGYYLAGTMFGVHCLLLGILLVRSVEFPKLLGYMMMVAAVGYLIESVGSVLAPQHEEVYAMIVLVPAVIGEFSVAIWLLLKVGRWSPFPKGVKA